MTLRATALFVASLFLATSSHGAENWRAMGFSVSSKDLPKVIAAVDEFMTTEAGQALPGTLSVMASVVDGADPATHSFITSMESLAAREQWISSIQADGDWIELRDTVEELVEFHSTSRMIFVKDWGASGEADVVWHLFGLVVSDDAAYLKALETLMASETGKQFPGSLYLSSVAASGMSAVTHVVSVGYQSEAEGEAWNETLLQSADWAAFQSATDGVSDVSGSWVLRTVKTWGAPPAAE